MYKLKTGIDMERLDWTWISANPAAVHLLEANPDKICWDMLAINPEAAHLIEAGIQSGAQVRWDLLSRNPGAVPILAAKIALGKDHAEMLCWSSVAANPSAIPLLEARMQWCPIAKIAARPDRIDWQHLSGNPNAVHLLEAFCDRIDWHRLAMNTNPKAIDLLVRYRFRTIRGRLEDIFERYGVWSCLSDNPAAIHLLEENLDRVDWKWLSANPAAIHILENNRHRISWAHLSSNPAAIHLMRDNPDMVNRYEAHSNPNAVDLLVHMRTHLSWKLSMNPGIFTYDYEEMKRGKKAIHREIMEELFHPNRIRKHLDKGLDLDDYLQ